jgi:hypothetical protein
MRQISLGRRLCFQGIPYRRHPPPIHALPSQLIGMLKLGLLKLPPITVDIEGVDKLGSNNFVKTL